ncbi:MAG: hypothetical protein IKO10_16515 [Lachnospiraceae bacterium]|nr:hypothetical protein [Lachnospiraceae bacterium]
MNPIDTDKAKKLYKEYYDEMMARSAWSGHEFAQDYLADLHTNIRNLLSQAFQGAPKNQNYDAMEILHELGKDYGDLTTKTFSSGFYSESDKKIIGDMLEKEFLNTLDKAVDLMDRIYVKQTGHTLLEDTNPEEVKYDLTHFIVKACMEENMKLYQNSGDAPFVPFIIDVLNNGNDFCVAEITFPSGLIRISFKDLSDDPLTISCFGTECISYEKIHNALLEMKEFMASKLREEESEQYPEDFEESLPFEKE